MIIKCKICKGSGRILSGSIFELLNAKGEVCPACSGAGEFEINLPRDKITTCKYCGGAGCVQPTGINFTGSKEICPACKGVGIITRPTIGKAKKDTNEREGRCMTI